MKQACIYQAPFGNITLIFDGGELIELNLHGDLVHAPYPLPEMWQQKLDDYFAGRLKNFAHPISSKGTPFQQKVWQAISEIPAGQVMSYPHIARQIGNHPHVHFLGFRPDAARLAGACDVAVMPSIEREGLPKAILESMALGIPPVVTDVGGLPELVEDGKCGYVVPPRDAEALRDALRALAQNAELRRRFGAAARARIEGPFNFRHTAEKTLALYRRLLESPAGTVPP